MSGLHRRDHHVLRALSVQLAKELGRSADVVHTELLEAVDAGLLRVTRTGVEAVVPNEMTE